MRICSLATLGFLLFYDVCRKTYGMEAVLLDTRTALSDLGWFMPIGSEWQEMTSSDSKGNQHRMLMVCQIRIPHQNNWIRSQYIPVQGAKRVYVEIEFTIRSCDDVPYVATCKETFNLYYYETDKDEASSTFPPWNEDVFTKVDTIAADQRFEPGSTKTNFEIRDIGPISKKGLYLAVQDTGACVALMHIRLYYMLCPEVTQNLAIFPSTTSGAEVTSLVEAKGVCVPFANQDDIVGASLYCNGKGEWTVPSGSCVCDAGYAPNDARTLCEACPVGYFKSTRNNQDCKRCPDYSISKTNGMSVCKCMRGYYRSPLDELELPCTKPPSKPQHLHSTVNGTKLSLTWQQPITTGGRSDLTYRIYCQSCDLTFLNCVKCSNTFLYNPSMAELNSRPVDVNRLSRLTAYKFQVCSINGVTNVAAARGQELNNCAETRFKNSQSGNENNFDIQIIKVTYCSIRLSWKENFRRPLQDFEVVYRAVANSDHFINGNPIYMRTREQGITLTELQPSTLYDIKIRAKVDGDFGPFSLPLRVRTISNDSLPDDSDMRMHPMLPQGGVNMNLVYGILGGVLFVAILISILLLCKRKKKKSMKKDVEKQNSIHKSNPVQFRQNCSLAFKTYVDPTSYEDFNKAAFEFEKEITKDYLATEDLIGEGEFCDVFRGRFCHPNSTEQQVAIKTLRKGSRGEQTRDFLNEASIMGQFDHPNVIRLEGVVTKSRPLMIITEYMDNGSLNSLLRNNDGEFSVLQLVGMLRHIAAGMKYLSDMGYVHRDLAARNVLVNEQMVCKVSDFGLSRILDEDTEAVFSFKGEKIPLRWTAPEAITFKKFTSASDVWSFGIVMWEVMSLGEIPYWEMSNQTVMYEVEKGHRLPAPLDCPQHLHQMMLECWKKDRNQRPRFGQLVSLLNDLLRESWKLHSNVSANDKDHISEKRLLVHSTLQHSRKSWDDFYRNRRSSFTPIATTDSGINEDSEEESPMFGSTFSSSLERWLNTIGLEQHHDNLLRHGCTSLEQVFQLNSSDLIRMGILHDCDQDALLHSINHLPLSNKASTNED